MASLNPKITQAGLALYPQTPLPGFQIKLTHIAIGTARYAPTGNETALQAEVARYPVLANLTSKPSATSIQVGVNITSLDAQGRSPDGKWIGEIGFYSDNTLFAVWSQQTNYLFYKSAEISVPFAYTLDVSILPAGSVTVVVSPDAAGMQALLFAHELASDPHPQYWNDARGGAKLAAHVQAADPHTQYWNDTRGANSLKAIGLGTNNAVATDDADDRTDLSVFKHFYTSTLNNTLSPQGTAAAAVVLSKITGTASFQLAAMYNTANTKPIMKFRLGNTSAWGGWRALATLDPSVTDPQVPACFSISALPTVNIGPIFVLEAEELWTWKSTAYFQGYRSNLCGRPVDGHTASPLASEIDAIGGLVSKTAYAGLWGYARENSLVVTQATWTANIGAFYFVDVDANNFRVPDLRNMSRRYTGTDADTGSARARGSRQLDALQNITGVLGSQLNVQTSAGGAFALAASGTGAYATGNAGDFNQFTFDASRVARTSSETRGMNTAFSPRIHI